MKNTIHLLCIILTTVLFASCSQAEWENDNKPISPIFQDAFEVRLGSAISPHEVSLENGRINFQSLEAFENLASQTTNQTFVAHFKSMVHGKGEYTTDPHAASYVQDDADDYLQGFIFNSDGLFQLGNLIFKVDVKENSLRFLPANKLEQLPALIEGREAADIEAVSVQYALGLDHTTASEPIPVICWMCLAGSIFSRPEDVGGAIATRVACEICKIQLGDDDEDDQER
ncbi:MAG: hypothetical protein AAGD28_27905 [Bacteroidota bacterium]